MAWSTMAASVNSFDSSAMRRSRFARPESAEKRAAFSTSNSFGAFEEFYNMRSKNSRLHGNAPHFTRREYLEKLGRALSEHVVDEAVHFRTVAGKGAVVHGHQPARANFLGELRSLGGIHVSGAADGQQRDADAIRAQALHQTFPRPAVAGVINGEAVQTQHVAEIRIAAFFGPVEVGVRGGNGIDHGAQAGVHILHPQIGVGGGHALIGDAGAKGVSGGAARQNDARAWRGGENPRKRSGVHVAIVRV